MVMLKQRGVDSVTRINQHRTHMEREHLPPMRTAEPEQVETLKLSEVVIKSHVGGLVRSFERKAAGTATSTADMVSGSPTITSMASRLSASFRHERCQHLLPVRRWG